MPLIGDFLPHGLPILRAVSDPSRDLGITTCFREREKSVENMCGKKYKDLQDEQMTQTSPP
jgi:hypothetical protein